MLPIRNGEKWRFLPFPFKNRMKMERAMTKKFLLGMLVLTLAFTTMGCIFSGTYTHDGNTATFRGDAGGTATVSGYTLTGISDGTRFSATRANTDLGSEFLSRFVWAASRESTFAYNLACMGW